ncbi:hypothetical protein [uncultured Tyzzerella sp.]|uniref:hypothetical protein n=1 Tax=uncultured Tyzzerella sp. TaxID=2321398 RepID=UPI002942BCE1|nr:hypothetical protein [uncultured Tyzzerella sp.]
MELIAGLVFGYGLYNCLCSILKIPDSAYVKPFRRFKTSTKSESIITEAKAKIYYQLLNYIKIDELKRKKLEKTLFLANIDKKPEEYTAEGLSELIFYTLVGVALVMINPMMPVILIVYGFRLYNKHRKYPYTMISINKVLIESELYRFVTTIEQELLIDTDVVRIIESFKNRTNDVFKKHLERCLTEMRTSNEISALKKLETRINSSMLSDVCRGLIALSRGENNREYFARLSTSFKSTYINQKRKEASLLPDRIKKYEIEVLVSLGLIGITAMIIGNLPSFK